MTSQYNNIIALNARCWACMNAISMACSPAMYDITKYEWPLQLVMSNMTCYLVQTRTDSDVIQKHIHAIPVTACTCILSPIHC